MIRDLTLHDVTPVVVDAEMTERHENWARLRVCGVEKAVRFEDGWGRIDRETLAVGPLGVPLRLALPRHVAEANGFLFDEPEPDEAAP